MQVHRYDGPWTDIDEDVKRNNLLLRYSDRTQSGGWNVALMGYDATWNSPDQMPRRAVESGLISELGSIDTTLGGDTSRYSFSGSWAADVGTGRMRANAYMIDYDLELFSNFTYFLDDPSTAINSSSATIARSRAAKWRTRSAATRARATRSARCCATTTSPTSGCSTRGAPAGRHHPQRQRRRAQPRLLLLERNTLERPLPHAARRARRPLRLRRHEQRARGELRLRGRADVRAEGEPDLLRDERPELYLSAGNGFHSNDARGTTITIDPTSGDPADR